MSKGAMGSNIESSREPIDVAITGLLDCVLLGSGGLRIRCSSTYPFEKEIDSCGATEN